MKILISIILILIIIAIGCYILDYIYVKYKENEHNKEFEILKMEERFNKRLNDMEHKQMVNMQLLNWLYDEVAKKNNKKVKKWN